MAQRRGAELERASLPERRSARKEATKARILEVAREHFERNGFEAASIRDVTDAAGVASGTVLLHFADKAGLLHSALHNDLEARHCAEPGGADPTGLPPLLVQAGELEQLVDQIRAFVPKAQESGVDVTFSPYKGMVHVWHLMSAAAPASHAALEEAGAFIRRHAAPHCTPK
jgi:AcrR family transcriptional regulator